MDANILYKCKNLRTWSKEFRAISKIPILQVDILSPPDYFMIKDAFLHKKKNDDIGL